MTITEKLKNGDYENKLPYVSHKENNPVARDAWRREEERVSDLFRSDVKAELLTQGVPEKSLDKVMNRAWEEGHSSGLSEVYNVAGELAELFS